MYILGHHSGSILNVQQLLLLYMERAIILITLYRGVPTFLTVRVHMVNLFVDLGTLYIAKICKMQKVG